VRRSDKGPHRPRRHGEQAARADRGQLSSSSCRVASISYPKRFEQCPRALFATAGGYRLGRRLEWLVPHEAEIGPRRVVRIVRSMWLTAAGGYHFARGIVEHAGHPMISVCVGSTSAMSPAMTRVWWVVLRRASGAMAGSPIDFPGIRPRDRRHARAGAARLRERSLA
jgi:hypothetical protein